ncbi:hypothetical protein ACP4OV_007845 [Aristida adscensionis]
MAASLRTLVLLLVVSVSLRCAAAAGSDANAPEAAAPDAAASASAGGPAGFSGISAGGPAGFSGAAAAFGAAADAGIKVAVEQACRLTKFPEFCDKTLSSAPPELKAEPGPGGIAGLAELSLALAAKSSAEIVAFVKNLERVPGGMPPECLEDCVAKFQEAVNGLRQSTAALEESKNVGGVNTLVMEAKTDGDSCLLGCSKVEGGADPNVRDQIGALDMLCSIALSLNDAAIRGWKPAA